MADQAQRDIPQQAISYQHWLPDRGIRQIATLFEEEQAHANNSLPSCRC
jgi:hypothetical protein